MAEIKNYQEAVLSKKADEYRQLTDNPLAKITLKTGEFRKIELPEKRMFLKAWVQEYSIIMVYGGRGNGKTMFALGLVNAISTGAKFGPWETITPARCLYLDGEMAAQDLQSSRLKLIDHDENVFVLSSAYANFKGLPAINLTDEPTRAQIKDILLNLDIKVFVIDNLSSLTGGMDENVKVAWDPLNQWLLELRFAGITSIFLHHDNKMGGQRGTKGREDQVDFVVNVGLPKDYEATDGCRFIAKFEKQRIPNEYLHLMAETEFKLDTDEHGNPVWTFKNVKADKKRQIIELLDSGVAQKDIPEIVGVGKGYVSTIKNQAIKAGELTENGKFTQAGFLKYQG
ncbi:AAA family ATPase [Desulfobacca acetoxidans]